MRFWLALHPDVAKPIGGVKQMHRLSEHLSSLGYTSTIIQEDSSFHPGWFESEVNTISLKQWNSLTDLSKFRDVIILPETYVRFFRSYSRGLPLVIFNQNGSYTFGESDPVKNRISPKFVFDSYNFRNVIQILCVSEHDKNLLSVFCDMPDERISLIVNGLDNFSCSNSIKKHNIISFMPRKNSFDAGIVMRLLSIQPFSSNFKFYPIANASHQEVMNVLQKSLIFLSFGHPEGFGLPVAEALASGCSVVGYTGLGGRELFDKVLRYNVAFPVENGDWPAFVNGVSSVVSRYKHDHSNFVGDLAKSSILIRQSYSDLAMQDSIKSAVFSIEKNLSRFLSSDSDASSFAF